MFVYLPLTQGIFYVVLFSFLCQTQISAIFGWYNNWVLKHFAKITDYGVCFSQVRGRTPRTGQGKLTPIKSPRKGSASSQIDLQISASSSTSRSRMDDMCQDADISALRRSKLKKSYCKFTTWTAPAARKQCTSENTGAVRSFKTAQINRTRTVCEREGKMV